MTTTTRGSIGSSGRDLLLELQRGGREGTFLPSYNTKLVRSCFDELSTAFRDIQAEAEAAAQAAGDAGKKLSMNVRPSILLHRAILERNKRYLLAYHKCRLDRIQKQIVLGMNPTGEFSTASAAENQFARDYCQLRAEYSSQVFDLGLLPPTSHMVQVRVLETLGEVLLVESGRSVVLTKGSLHFLPRSDVLEFLEAGSVELVDGEEVDY